MTFIKKTIAPIAAALCTASIGSAAYAASGEAKTPEHHHWHFAGPFGKFDTNSVQRGYQVYETICSNCHGLELVAFRHLGQKGGPFYLDHCPTGIPENINCSNPNDNPVVKAIAANYKFQVADGPDDSGDMFNRPAVPSDQIPGPYANDQFARLANNNALPPDLSLITKARHHGPDYVRSLLVGYEDAPHSVEIAPGQYYNPYFHGDMSQAMKAEMLDGEGHVIDGVEVPLGGVLAMAPPLADGIIEYVDGSPQTVEQYASDVTEFLMWAAEPKMEERKALGVISLGYLIVLAGLLYWSYRKVWANQPH